MKILKTIAIPAAAALVLAGCSSNGASDTAEAPADQSAAGETTGETPKIVASIYPLEYLANQIVGDAGEVSSLAQQGSDTHDVELTPSQIASIGEADLVLSLKDFQPAVDSAIEQSGNENVLLVNDIVDLIEGGHDHGDEEHAHEEEGHDDHAHDEEGHDDHAHDEEEHADEEHAHGEEAHAEEAHDDHAHEEDGHEGHNHGDFDPHFWQDPERMKEVAESFTEKLTEQYPDNAEAYKANLAAFSTEMDAIEDEYEQGLAECSIKEFITPHEAFQYLTEETDLEEVSIVGISSNEEPSPARIAEIQKVAKETGVNTIFFETLTSPAVSEAIAGDLGLKTAVLDPLENVTDNSPGDDYPSIMRANLEALKSANECK